MSGPRATGHSLRVHQLGFWSAILMILSVLSFDVGLLVSPSLAFLSSLFLAWTFLASMVCIHHYATEDKKVWSHLGLVFGTMYATMNSIVYYVQLVVVRTNPLNVSSGSLQSFIYTPGSVFFAIDLLGYGLLTLAMLFAAPVFGGDRLERALRWLFAANGLLFIPVLLYPALISAPVDTSSNFGSIVLLGWSAIFIPAIALLALLFRRAEQVNRNSRR